jgi:hypothetical protein
MDNIPLALYFVTVYIITYLGLAWHFASCRLQDKTIKPYVCKQVKLAMTAERRNTDRGSMTNRSLSMGNRDD